MRSRVGAGRRAGPAGTRGADRSADPYLPAHGNGGYRVGHYDLEIGYRVGPSRLVGRAVLTAEALQPLSRFTVDLNGFRVSRVLVDGRTALFSRRGHKLSVSPARVLPAGPFVVEVRYAGHPRPIRGRWGDVGWTPLPDGVLVTGRPVGAPSWFPCNDHLADRAGYRIAITTDSAHQVLATGLGTARRRGPGTRTWVFELSEPTASHLVTVQIGRYEELAPADGPAAVPVLVPSRLRRAAARDLDRVAAIRQVLERFFGPCPFRGLQVVVVDGELADPVAGPGLTAFGANHVDGRGRHERVLVRGLAGQWFGSAVTPADWRQAWLTEAFLSYAGWLWSEAAGGRTAATHAMQWHARLAAAPADLLLADVGVSRLFDRRVGPRGGMMLHALRTRIGDERFFGLLFEWATRYRQRAVTGEQFVALAGRHAPEDLTGFFAGWLHARALPALRAD